MSSSHRRESLLIFSGNVCFSLFFLFCSWDVWGFVGLSTRNVFLSFFPVGSQVIAFCPPPPCQKIYENICPVVMGSRWGLCGGKEPWWASSKKSSIFFQRKCCCFLWEVWGFVERSTGHGGVFSVASGELQVVVFFSVGLCGICPFFFRWLGENYKLITLHSLMTPEQQHEAFERPPEGFRKAGIGLDRIGGLGGCRRLGGGWDPKGWQTRKPHCFLEDEAFGG